MKKIVLKHTINHKQSPAEAMTQLNSLGSESVLILVDEQNKLVGSLTDGDLRRGLLKGLNLQQPLSAFVQENPLYWKKADRDYEKLEYWRTHNYVIIPVVDEAMKVIDIISFRSQKSYLPMDAVIMAGGKGSRLLPLTKSIPKPLLKVGDKPIIEYNIDHLKNYGVEQIYISINYLGQQLIDTFQDGSEKSIHISYIEEDIPKGTIGSVSSVTDFTNEYVLVMNSDVLTNIDLEAMFLSMLDDGSDMVVATVPFEVQIPYGVVSTESNQITGLTEKPTYTYYSNAGIYIIKKDILKMVPCEGRYDATDLILKLCASKSVVTHFPVLGYWLDIGKPADFQKAQKDIKHIKFS